MTLDTEPDLSVFVLNLLDEHIAAMVQARERLRPGCLVSPGGRLTIALQSATTAQRYASELTTALGLELERHSCSRTA
jgi:hypothetical protein